MPPPPLTAANSTEKSPRHREGGTPRDRGSQDKARSEERERRRERERADRMGETTVGADAFEISFGDLPSPRVIEVIRAKEIVLPSWRLVATDLLPPSFNRPKTKNGAKGKTNGKVEHPPAQNGDCDDDSGEEDDGDDETFERRHVRTLERAIAAARTVAREMALKARQKQQEQQPAGKPSDGRAGKPSDGKAGKPSDGPLSPNGGNKPMTDEEEWRFRPSELAALFAAQRLSGAELLGLNGGSSSGSAGFFGRGGANRNRDRDRAEEEEGKADGSAAERGAGEASAAKGEAMDVAEPNGELEENGVVPGYRTVSIDSVASSSLMDGSSHNGSVDGGYTPLAGEEEPVYLPLKRKGVATNGSTVNTAAEVQPMVE